MRMIVRGKRTTAPIAGRRWSVLNFSLLARASRPLLGWVVVGMNVNQSEGPDAMHLHLCGSTRAGEMRHGRRHRHEVVHLVSDESCSGEVLAHPSEKGPLEHGDVFIG